MQHTALKEVKLYISCTYKINQCLAARIVYSLNNSDLMHEITVYATDYIASIAVGIHFSFYSPI